MRLRDSVACAFVITVLSAGVSHSTTGVQSYLNTVPDSKLILEQGRERILQTAKGTTIEMELKLDGSIEEASGQALTKGDVFIPGNGLLNLSEAVNALEKSGKKPLGQWSFERSLRHGWIYEFEGIENGQKRNYAVDAKDGKLVIDRVDY